MLAPGGRLAILEITQPRGVLAPFYRVWFDRIVPLLGKGLKGGEAYAYLPASVRRFPGPDELAALMREAGLDDVQYRTFAGGIVALHIGRGPRERPRDDPRDAGPVRVPRRARGAPAGDRALARRRSSRDVSRDALSAGGKRLRPLLVFFSVAARTSRRRSPRASQSSSSTWRRSSTTT